MKIKGSLSTSLVLILTLITAAGCTSLGKRALNGTYPDNAVVIRNATRYSLLVEKNGKVWTNPPSIFPTVVLPNQELVLLNCSSRFQEQITVRLTARKITRFGCLVGETTEGSHAWQVNVGVESPPEMIVAKGWHF